MPPPSSEVSAAAGAEPLKRRLTWVSFWRVVTATVVMALTTSRFMGRREELAPAELVPFLLIAVIYVLTLVYGLVLRTNQARSWLAWVQVGADAALITSLVYLTGGGDSPFVFLYLVVEIVAAILLGLRGAAAAGSVGAVTFLALLFLSQASVLHPVGSQSPWPMERLAFLAASNVMAQVLVAILAGWLASLLSATGGQLRAREEELRDVRELQRQILAVMPSGLITCDATGTITFANAAAASILGRSEAELPGTGIDAVVPGARSIAPSARRAELDVDGGGSGVSKRLGLTVSRLGETAGGLLIVFQDLTELRRAEARLNQVDRLAAVGKFAAQLAHEIRNPLAAMRGAAQLLASPSPVASAQTATLSGILVREGDRLGALVDDFLKFSRPQAPNRVPTRLDALVHETVEMLRNDPLSAGVNLRERSDSLTLAVDEGQLRQVLLNLIRNALTAVANAGEVRVSLLALAESAELSVWDSAGSISRSDLDHIFEPFFTTRAAGTGLGLSTALAIVTAHGGSIDVSSSREAGTEFRVRLPLKAGA